MTRKYPAGKFLSTQDRGFSLIEMMVVVAIGSIIAASLATMTTNANRAVMGVSATSDFNSLVTTLQGVINNSATCATVFGGVTLPAGGYPKAMSPICTNGLAGGATCAGGVTLAQTGVFGNSLNIQTLVFNAAPTLISGNSYSVPLIISANRVVSGGAVAGGVAIPPHIFDMIVTLDVTNKITACSGLNANNYWQQATNGATNIDYTAGNVGIGTTTPQVALDVNGGIRPGAATTGNFCAPNPEGTLAYDSAAHAPVYCSNIGKWTAMGGKFGGSFDVHTIGGACWTPNPKTGSCTCPAGTAAHLSGQAFRFSQWDTTVSICY